MVTPPEPSARPAWVHQRLSERGTSLAKLARAKGVTPQALSHALRHPNKWLEEVIADACGVTPEWLLFPDRYDETGQRLSQVRQLNRTANAARRNVQRSYTA